MPSVDALPQQHPGFQLCCCCSNDVRRFDDGISFWLFVWAGPLEAALVLLMVSLELGFVPAVCGMAAMLAVIPIQVRSLLGVHHRGDADF